MPRHKLFDEKEVLEKAIYIFWEKGYNKTSMQDLVSALGVHRGSLYDTFGGKKQLFMKAFTSYIESNNSFMVQFLDKQKSVKEGLLNFFEAPIEASKCNNGNRGCLVVNTATEMLPLSDDLVALLNKNRIKLESIFHDFLQKGQKNNEFSKDIDIKSTASFFYTILNGVLVIGKINSDKEYLMNIVKTSLSVLDKKPNPVVQK